MYRVFTVLLTVVCIHLSGCKPPTPPPVEATAPTEPRPEPQLSPEPKSKPVAPPTAPTIQEEYAFTLLSGPWAKYLNASVAPKILVIAPPSKGIRELLSEEQELIKAVLDANASLAQTSEHSALTDRLDQLKAAVPSAETSSGYVRTRRNYNRTYISGSTIYTNSDPYYSSYSVFHTKEKSSSPDLVRSVSGIVTNATLEDIDQRIDALQKTISTWTRRTSIMSLNGTAGIIRDANEAYLEGLKDYTSEFINIRKELRKIEQSQAQKAQNKASILQNWKTFEKTRLSILRSYFEDNKLESIEPVSERSYTLTESQLANPLVLSCQIGPRILYFELTDRHHPNHPFLLVDTTAPDDK